MNTLKKGDTGAQVVALQNALIEKGFDPGGASGSFGQTTSNALMDFQRSVGLVADGVAGPRTLTALGLVAAPPLSMIPCVTAEMAAVIVPFAPRPNIETNLPYVLNGLVGCQLADKAMIAMALGTIRAETGSFEPISEGISQFNTASGGAPYGLYDSRADLGNQGPPDGERFKGRGFIQLTGRANYLKHGQDIGLGDELVNNPDLANDPTIAGKLLASFLKAHEQAIRQALDANNLRDARKLVNGGHHGQDEFSESYALAVQLLPQQIDVVMADAAARAV